MTTKLSDYEIQANEFLSKTGTTFKCKFVKYDRHFLDLTTCYYEKTKRNIYNCTLTRGEISISITFGQSIQNTELGIMPTSYDLLAAIQKVDPGTLEQFCSDYGYDQDSFTVQLQDAIDSHLKGYKLATKKHAYTILYNRIVKEFAKVQKLFTQDEIELLQEIN